MHITLTQQEVNTYIKRYFSIPDHVEVTVSIQPEVTTSEKTDGWIINTQTQSVCPPDLDLDDSIIAMFTNGNTYEGVAASWDVSWNTKNSGHIVKYRKI